MRLDSQITGPSILIMIVLGNGVIGSPDGANIPNQEQV